MINHPSSFISKELAAVMRKYAGEAEGLRHLHPNQHEALFHQNWFNLYVPKNYGGLELSLPEIVKIEEGLAWADGSTAWVVTLCSGAAWFIGFLDQGLSKEIFSNERVCVAGSGAATGTAEITKEGYLINGQWKYASGSLLATAFTANCVIHQNGSVISHQDGSPVIKSFLMKREEVTINRSWNAMGMIATGSHSFEVKNLTVRTNRCFTIDVSCTTLPHIIFQYPFLQLAETTLCANLSGMAVQFLDLCYNLFATKEKHSSKSSSLGKLLTETKQNLAEHREKFYEALEFSWSGCVSGVLSPAILKKISDTSLALAHQSRLTIDRLYPYAGLAAANTQLEINRVWRNFHTAGQHALFHRSANC